MPGATKLLTPGGGGVTLQPASSIASDVVVQVPSVAGTVLLKESTSGMSVPAFSAYAGSSTNMSTGTSTKVLFNTKEFDTASSYDAATNSRFQPTIPGYYALHSGITISGSGGAGEALIIFYKNGVEWKRGMDTVNNVYLSVGSCLIYLNGTTDYAEVYMYHSYGTTKQTVASSNQTYFQGYLVRAA